MVLCGTTASLNSEITCFGQKWLYKYNLEARSKFLDQTFAIILSKLSSIYTQNK